eukprot:6495145-Prymnesium_polylepis.1
MRAGRPVRSCERQSAAHPAGVRGAGRSRAAALTGGGVGAHGGRRPVKPDIIGRADGCGLGDGHAAALEVRLDEGPVEEEAQLQLALGRQQRQRVLGAAALDRHSGRARRVVDGALDGRGAAVAA